MNVRRHRHFKHICGLESELAHTMLIYDYYLDLFLAAQLRNSIN